MIRTVATLGVAVLSYAVQSAPEKRTYPPCSVERTSRGHLTSPATFDTVTVTIRGTPCYDATLLLEIRNGDDVVYRYATDFKRHTAVRWDDDDFPVFASDVAGRLAAGWETADRLPDMDVIDPTERGAEKNFHLLISASKYGRLRTSKTPVFRHSERYRKGVWVYFEPVARKVVPFLRYAF